VFSGPAECGADDQLLQLTRGLLKSHANHGEIRVDAAVSRRSNGQYGLHLELRGSVEGIRYLVAANCDEALRAASVVIALAVNPEVFAAVSEDTPPPAVVADEQGPQATVPAATDPSQDAKPPAPPGTLPASTNEAADQQPLDRPDVRLKMGAFGRFADGVTDAPRLGVGAALGLALGPVQVRLQGFVDPTTDSRDVLIGVVQFTSYGAVADLCARLADGSSLGIALCGGWQLTRVSANAPELSRPSQRDALVSAGVVGVSVEWNLVSGIAVVADGGVALPTTRPRFVVDLQGGETIALSKVRPGPTAALGLQWSL
jgi:hypothetical protein